MAPRIQKVRRRRVTLDQYVELQSRYGAERETVKRQNQLITELRAQVDEKLKRLKDNNDHFDLNLKRYEEQRALLLKRLNTQVDHVRIAVGICQRGMKNKKKASAVRQALAVLQAAVDEEASYKKTPWASWLSVAAISWGLYAMAGLGLFKKHAAAAPETTETKA
jgi:hypothetical protein